MFFSRKELLALAAAFVLPVALRGAEQNPARAPRVVMNIVNFVRSLDPRHPRSWHGEALREEAAKSDPALTEFGLWFEMSDRKSTRLNSSHTDSSRMPSSA